MSAGLLLGVHDLWSDVQRGVDTDDRTGSDKHTQSRVRHTALPHTETRLVKLKMQTLIRYKEQNPLYGNAADLRCSLQLY